MGQRVTSRRGREARRGLTQSRRETATVTQDRDDLLGQRQTARTYTASTLGDGDASLRVGRDPGRRDPRPGRLRLFARRPAGRPETLPGQAADAPAADAPASASAPAE